MQIVGCCKILHKIYSERTTEEFLLFAARNVSPPVDAANDDQYQAAYRVGRAAGSAPRISKRKLEKIEFSTPSSLRCH